MLALAILSCVLAAIPAALFIRNLPLYRCLPPIGSQRRSCSVLIPARDEEANLPAAIQSVVRSTDVDLELIVLDDHSTDQTAEIVRQFAAADRRVRLASGVPLPPRWCGKNFACDQLARLASHPVLIFMDADVRISRADSLARLAEFLDQSGAALISGVPREETRTLGEQLIIPLIHFVLLGFLPLERMRASTDPRFAAACGQIMAVRRDAYIASGGHAAIRDRVHDAVALTRQFRASGYGTDLFDATDTFHCRMYSSAGEVWRGFSKNAHEGLGSRALIIPATLLLAGGQVLPLWLLFAANSRAVGALAVVATVAAYLPRAVAAHRFRQSALSVALHPVAICLFLSIQWIALLRRLMGRAPSWKGRDISPPIAACHGSEDAEASPR